MDLMIKLLEGRGVAFSDIGKDEDGCYHMGAFPCRGTLYLMCQSNGVDVPIICYDGEKYGHPALYFEIMDADTKEWIPIDLSSVKKHASGEISLELFDH